MKRLFFLIVVLLALSLSLSAADNGFLIFRDRLVFNAIEAGEKKYAYLVMLRDGAVEDTFAIIDSLGNVYWKYLMKTDSMTVEIYLELPAGSYAKFLGTSSFHDSVAVGAVFFVYEAGDTTFINPLSLISSYAEYDSVKSSWAELDSISTGVIWTLDGKIHYFVGSTGVDTAYIQLTGSSWKFWTNNQNFTFTGGNVSFDGHILGYGDDKKFEMDGYQWYMDYDDDNQYAYIYFHGPSNEALVADSAGELLEWIGKKFKAKYVEADSIHGSAINDQFAYQCAGDIFSIATNTVALLGWITPATTEQDLSPHNHDFNYHNFETLDRTYKGLVWKLNFYAEANEYLHAIDHDDFTFDDAGGANGFTMGGWVEVVATTSDSQTIWSKWDETTATPLREWRMYIGADEKLVMMLYDESADADPYRTSDAAISVGWHLALAVYDGAGGVSAAGGITFYVDGKPVASTASNDINYVGMENTNAYPFVGAIIEDVGITNKDFWQSDMGHIFITTDQFTADQAWALYLRTRGYYNE